MEHFGSLYHLLLVFDGWFVFNKDILPNQTISPDYLLLTCDENYIGAIVPKHVHVVCLLCIWGLCNASLLLSVDSNHLIF